MPLIRYEPRKFSPASLERIDQANAILDEYAGEGYSLTLRQLYYQFVARGLVANRQSEYKRLGDLVNNARLAGLIDWLAIEDRTRYLRRLASWSSGGDIIEAAAHSFRVDVWRDQPAYVEVWIEKDALVGVIERPCEALRVPFFACRGYTSQSEAWRAGVRLRTKLDAGKRVIILHLGDHDPSGIDMTRDNADRLALFAEDINVEVERLALNYDQVEQYRPPPNPAKLTDSRARDYIWKYGEESWELDALEPRVIGQLITDAVEAVIDWSAWREATDYEDAERQRLVELAETWQADG